MKRNIFVILCTLMFCGCAALQKNPESITGEWQFSHIQRGPFFFGGFPPPPQFDTIIFTEHDRIHLKSSLMNWNFAGTYTVSGKDLKYIFQPPDVSEPIEHKVEYSFIDRGKSLVIKLNDTELVYYRPERFFPNEINGEWVQEVEGQKLTMELGEEGQYLLVEANVVGHYRLWPSRYGKTISAIVFIPDHGGYLMLWKYELENNNLTMTPISANGLEEKGKTTWERKTQNRTTK